MTSIVDQTSISAQASMAMANANGGIIAGRSHAAAADPTQVKKAAEKFVGMFMSQMFTPMFDGVGKDTMFGGGAGEDMFKSVLIDEYGKAAAKQGGMGMTDQIMRALIAQQEKQS